MNAQLQHLYICGFTVLITTYPAARTYREYPLQEVSSLLRGSLCEQHSIIFLLRHGAVCHQDVSQCILCISHFISLACRARRSG